MRFPDNAATRLTELIMSKWSDNHPNPDTGKYNATYSKVYDILSRDDDMPVLAAEASQFALGMDIKFEQEWPEQPFANKVLHAVYEEAMYASTPTHNMPSKLKRLKGKAKRLKMKKHKNRH